jgi:hypothetical protein
LKPDGSRNVNIVQTALSYSSAEPSQHSIEILQETISTRSPLPSVFTRSRANETTYSWLLASTIISTKWNFLFIRQDPITYPHQAKHCAKGDMVIKGRAANFKELTIQGRTQTCQYCQ